MADVRTTQLLSQVFLRRIAAKFFKSDISMADIARDVHRVFGVHLASELLEELQEHMVASREIYGAARTKLKALNGFGELLEFETKKPDAMQMSDTFETVQRLAPLPRSEPTTCRICLCTAHLHAHPL